MKPKKPRLNHDPAELFGKEARKGLQPLLRRLFSAMVVIGESSTGQSEELRKAGELQALALTKRPVSFLSRIFN